MGKAAKAEKAKAKVAAKAKAKAAKKEKAKAKAAAMKAVMKKAKAMKAPMKASLKAKRSSRSLPRRLLTLSASLQRRSLAPFLAVQSSWPCSTFVAVCQVRAKNHCWFKA